MLEGEKVGFEPSLCLAQNKGSHLSESDQEACLLKAKRKNLRLCAYPFLSATHEPPNREAFFMLSNVKAHPLYAGALFFNY